ncbi:MAG: biopolymer transporter ExbD [Candidatus Aminicenantes bacterium]|nr:MAG: biopolymer transporter ExbD [Candidatus Aminicenantes bacterium]
MAFAVGEKKDDVISEPNVVPLCDILLVLLIIFMIMTPLIKAGIDVDLPVALNTVGMPENPEVVLAIKKEGNTYNLFLNQQPVTMENLQLMVEEAFLTASDTRLYIRADGDTEYGEILEVAMVLKDAGVEIVGIITEVRAEGEQVTR